MNDFPFIVFIEKYGQAISMPLDNPKIVPWN